MEVTNMTLRKLLGLCALIFLLLGILCAAGAEEMAQDITEKCDVRVSEGDRHSMTDGNVRSPWYYDAHSAKATITLPKGYTGGGIIIEWLHEPYAYQLIEYDAKGNQLQVRDQDDCFKGIYTFFEFMPDTAKVVIQINHKQHYICEIHVCSQGAIPSSVQIWEPTLEKADIMLIVAHQDDEELWFGGLIPYYALVKKKNVVVVYMTNCKRLRKREGLNGLWAMGIHNYPVFLDLEDNKTSNFNKAVEAWGGKDNILNLMSEVIRKYKPEVIVTHDFKGEYGHGQHKLTAAACKYAIDAAANPKKFPDTVKLYGTWQVKKQYNHLYKKNEIQMDWDTPCEELGGKSPHEVGEIGYSKHKSQQIDYQMIPHDIYDNSKYGLYFTLVGEDVAKNDFLENIPSDDAESEFDLATENIMTDTQDSFAG